MENFETKQARSTRIIKSVIKELDMNITEFSEAIGMGYMQVYYIANGTTKTISEEMINAIKRKFPSVRTNFLLFGTGSVMGEDTVDEEEQKSLDELFSPSVDSSDMIRLFNRLLDYLEKVRTREEELNEIHKRLLSLEERLEEKLQK